jgi:heme/copper-type cytochrome/quinol oxidase subunit 4
VIIGHTEKIWLVLIGLTFAGALLGETGHAGWPLTLTVFFLIAFKGGIVIDYYMEMRSANTRIRNILRMFVALISLLVIVSHGWGEVIRRLTTIN